MMKKTTTISANKHKLIYLAIKLLNKSLVVKEFLNKKIAKDEALLNKYSILNNQVPCLSILA